jgi:hypothetical protein
MSVTESVPGQWRGPYSTRSHQALGSKGPQPCLRAGKKVSDGCAVVYTGARPNTANSQPHVKNPLQHSSIGQQLALITACLCLLVSLALVTLAAISTRHMQLQQQEEYGSALARQIATRISTALETGDLLSVSASLQRFVETSSAEEVAIFDVEGKALGRRGTPLARTSASTGHRCGLSRTSRARSSLPSAPTPPEPHNCSSY